MAKVSPLHGVIDAAKWDTQRLHGRLIVLIHAAFLYAGLAPDDASKAIKFPKQMSKTSSSFSLRYASPPHLPRDTEPVLSLRVYTQRRCVVVSGEAELLRRSGVGRWVTHWLCTDAVALAPLLSGSLDDTARALRSGGEVGRLWTALTEGFFRRVLVDICRDHGVELQPSFASLPGDIKSAILGRLEDKELAMVECAGRDMRRFVADHDNDLWKHRYEALATGRWFFLVDDDAPAASSWKEKYARARGSHCVWPYLIHRARAIIFRPFHFYHSAAQKKSIDEYWDQEWLPWNMGNVPRRRRRRRGKGGSGGERTVAPPWTRASGSGQGRKPRRAGVAYSPSSRCRWAHR